MKHTEKEAGGWRTMQAMIKRAPTYATHVTGIISFSPPANRVGLVLFPFYKKGLQQGGGQNLDSDKAV